MQIHDSYMSSEPLAEFLVRDTCIFDTSCDYPRPMRVHIFPCLRYKRTPIAGCRQREAANTSLMPSLQESYFSD